MKYIAVIAALLFSASGLAAHPLHLSVTNITYENGLLQVSLKTFLDDWETAYFHYHSQVIDFSDPASRDLPWFRGYLEQSISLSTEEGGAPVKMAVDTIILDGGSMVITLHAQLTKQPKSLYIYNALLTDIYPDQTNLVIFGSADRQAGMKFDGIKSEGIVPLK
jgi:hypothetical protein